MRTKFVAMHITTEILSNLSVNVFKLLLEKLASSMQILVHSINFMYNCDEK